MNQVTISLSQLDKGPTFALLGDEDTLRTLIDLAGEYTGPLEVDKLHKKLLQTLLALQALEPWK